MNEHKVLIDRGGKERIVVICPRGENNGAIGQISLADAGDAAMHRANKRVAA